MGRKCLRFPRQNKCQTLTTIHKNFTLHPSCFSLFLFSFSLLWVNYIFMFNQTIYLLIFLRAGFSSSAHEQNKVLSLCSVHIVVYYYYFFGALFYRQFEVAKWRSTKQSFIISLRLNEDAVITKKKRRFLSSIQYWICQPLHHQFCYIYLQRIIDACSKKLPTRVASVVRTRKSCVSKTHFSSSILSQNQTDDLSGELWPVSRRASSSKIYPPYSWACLLCRSSEWGYPLYPKNKKKVAPHLEFILGWCQLSPS